MSNFSDDGKLRSAYTNLLVEKNSGSMHCFCAGLVLLLVIIWDNLAFGIN